MPDLLTYADLASFPDDGLRRELIGGELIVSPSPKTRHQVVSGRLFLLFGNHLESNGGGWVYYAPLDVLFSDYDVVEPDLIIVLDEQQAIVTEPNIKGAPALLIEIVSTSNPRLDRVRKRDLYAKYGVAEYWIVDPDADRIEVYRLESERYRKPEIFEPPETTTYDRLAGLHVDLTQLFAR